MSSTGKILMVSGALIFMAGVLVWLGGDKLKWLGHLPGDIRLKRPGFSFFMPLTSMILVSVCVSLVLWLIRKFF